MPRRGDKPRFEGHERVASPAEIDAFVGRASKGERFIYCEAVQLIRGATSLHAGELVRKGFVTTHHERRAGGGWIYFVQRTSLVWRAPGRGSGGAAHPGQPGRGGNPSAPSASDSATATILRMLTRAANLTLKCPSDSELAQAVEREDGWAGFTRDQAQARVRKLVEAGTIRSTVATEDGVPTRVVTIAATGRRTALPPKWAALDRAERRGAAVPASPTFPRARGGAL